MRSENAELHRKLNSAILATKRAIGDPNLYVGDSNLVECIGSLGASRVIAEVAAKPLTEDVEAHYCPPKDDPPLKITHNYFGVDPRAFENLRSIVKSHLATEGDIVAAAQVLFDRTAKPPRIRVAEAMIEERSTRDDNPWRRLAYAAEEWAKAERKLSGALRVEVVALRDVMLKTNTDPDD
jgi:hypothetical protein